MHHKITVYLIQYNNNNSNNVPSQTKCWDYSQAQVYTLEFCML